MSAADPVVQPWITQARSVIGPAMPDVIVEDFDGPANAETKYEAGAIRLKWRRNYPMQLHLPSPNAQDLALAKLDIEYTACHDLGHGIAAWLRSLGIDVEGELYDVRGFTNDPVQDRALADAEGVEVGWPRHPWERVAETMRAAIGGRWIRPERTLNENKTIEPMDARAWLLGLIARAIPVTPTPSLPPPTTGGSMKVIDMRSQLPLATQFIPSPSHAFKTSNTVHWTGGHDTIVTDEQAIAAIKRWHQQHINTDWNKEAPGQQGGAGLMYVEVIAPSGTVLITRDPDAVTWHCSDAHGNAHSRPILVICDQDEPPTNQQLASLDSRITFPEFQPHSFWVGTQCPGPECKAFIDERRVDDMFTAQDREDLRRVRAQLDAEGPRIWTQRLQEWLSRLLHSLPIFAAGDFKGPDVTSGQPRT